MAGEPSAQSALASRGPRALRRRPAAGTTTALVDRADQTTTDEATGELAIEAASFRASGIDATNVVDLGRCTPFVLPGTGDESPLLANPLTTAERAFKRALDIVVASVVLVLTLPLLIAAAIAVRLETPGPAVYRHDRLGAGGRRFRCYKLRTMRMADDDEAHREFLKAIVRCEATPENGLFKRVSDPRITRLGRWLRRLSIDELPQLWNVLKGDMSIVGPRPPVLTEAAMYSPLDWQRLCVKPGLTGLAQLRGRSRLRFDQIVAADIEYARSWSPLLELKILARTPLAIVTAKGAG